MVNTPQLEFGGTLRSIGLAISLALFWNASLAGASVETVVLAIPDPSIELAWDPAATPATTPAATPAATGRAVEEAERLDFPAVPALSRTPFPTPSDALGTPEVKLAQMRRDDEREDRRASGPSRAEIRGHEQEMTVRRRSARPIPRVTSPRRRHRPGDRSYRTTHHYVYHGYGVHHDHHGHHGHIHHAHCGHAYDDQGYGDSFGARTLGRSCVYGPKGEVIYKPADVICAPKDDGPKPTAATPQPFPESAPEQAIPAETPSRP